MIKGEIAAKIWNALFRLCISVLVTVLRVLTRRDRK